MRGKLFLHFRMLRTLSKAHRTAQHPPFLGVKDFHLWSWAAHTQAEGELWQEGAPVFLPAAASHFLCVAVPAP